MCHRGDGGVEEKAYSEPGGINICAVVTSGVALRGRSVIVVIE